MEQDGKKQPRIGQGEPASKSTDFSRWIGEQLGLLALALDVKLADERLQIYVSDLLRSGIPRAQLEVAFNRARNECTFFPKIAELRALAGVGTPKQGESVEAMAAWETAEKYLRRWGVDRLPEYRGGKWIMAPALDPRIEYALRRIGGLPGLNQITEEKRPFMLRDFCKGFDEAPVADVMGLLPAPQEQRLQLEEKHEGAPVDMADLKQQLLQAAKMPEAAPVTCRVTAMRQVPPALPLTRQQIEGRKDAERAEIERERRRMEEA